MNYYERSLELHQKHRGKIEIRSKVPLESKDDLSLAYTPGVAEPCRRIHADPALVNRYTNRGNTVAVITDGTAVLGLGDIGPQAGLPVMEGKCLLFKEFAGIDAIPILLGTKDVDEIVRTIQHIAPTFGGINLEDISAPRCFEIEQRLIESLNIPVFHDDQHGTAIVVLAGLINALKLTGRKLKESRIVVNGVGAAGVAITRLLIAYGANPALFFLCDSKGTIYKGRGDLNPVKEELARITNAESIQGGLAQIMEGADVFIGVSQPRLVTPEMVRSMAKDSIVFAMANPEPEILPDLARQAGAAIAATGRSDFPNQINNVLGFPGIFRGVLDAGLTRITQEIKFLAAETIAESVERPTPEMIIPNALDRSVAKRIGEAIVGLSR